MITTWVVVTVGEHAGRVGLAARASWDGARSWNVLSVQLGADGPFIRKQKSSLLRVADVVAQVEAATSERYDSSEES